jgi:ABC-type uncharacterized transport system ATPase subunit
MYADELKRLGTDPTQNVLKYQHWSNVLKIYGEMQEAIKQLKKGPVKKITEDMWIETYETPNVIVLGSKYLSDNISQSLLREELMNRMEQIKHPLKLPGKKGATLINFAPCGQQ